MKRQHRAHEVIFLTFELISHTDLPVSTIKRLHLNARLVARKHSWHCPILTRQLSTQDIAVSELFIALLKIDLRDAVSTDISPFHIALGVLVHFYAVHVYQHDIRHPFRASNDIVLVEVQIWFPCIHFSAWQYIYDQME